MIVCSFSSGIDDMKRKDQADTAAVLRVLHKNPRFSCFEATANQTIAKTMTRIFQRGYVVVVGDDGYPWTSVKLTDAGLALIGEVRA